MHSGGDRKEAQARVPAASMPRHVAVIMDGNGRWARARSLPRLQGHEAGAESVRCILRRCRDLGIPYLTLFAFSHENWSRPPAEVKGLMRLLRRFLRDNLRELHRRRIRFRTIGRLFMLPDDLQRELADVERATAGYDAHHLTLALSYGGRQEIVDATRAIAEAVRAGNLAPGEIDEASIREHLYAPDLPDPDLLIRTSGELRLSNFLLWQLSYAEIYVTQTLWPDFREEAFAEAVRAYARRERRFGAVNENETGGDECTC